MVGLKGDFRLNLDSECLVSLVPDPGFTSNPGPDCESDLDFRTEPESERRSMISCGPEPGFRSDPDLGCRSE